MILETARKVLQIEADSVREQVSNLGTSFVEAVTEVSQSRGRLCVTGKEAICGRSAQGSANTGEEFRLTGTSVGGKELAPVSYYAARDRFQKADLSGATALSARMCGGWSKL